MNYLVAKKALRDTMSAEDYTETIDFSELIDFPTLTQRIQFDDVWYEHLIPSDPWGANKFGQNLFLGPVSPNLISTDLHLDMILLGYIPA